MVIGGVKIGRGAEPHIRIGFYIPTIRYYNSKMSTTDTTYCQAVGDIRCACIQKYRSNNYGFRAESELTLLGVIRGSALGQRKLSAI